MFRYNFSLLIAVICIIIHTSCAHDSNKTPIKQTVISGVVKNIPEDATFLILNYCDMLSDIQKYGQDLRISDGKFHITHDYIFGQNITIKYDRSFINIYVNPGDSVFVEIDAIALREYKNDAVKFSGDNATFNDQLQKWINYAYRLPVPEFESNSKEEFLYELGTYFRSIKDTIESFAQKNEMSDQLKEWAFTDYKFVIANYLTDYPKEITTWDVFTDPVFDIYDDDNLQSMMFPYHLDVCISLLLNENKRITGSFNEKNFKKGIRMTIEELSVNTQDGPVGDFMIFLAVKNIIDRVDMPEIFDSIPELKKCFTDPVFSDKLRSYAQAKIDSRLKPVLTTGNLMQGVSYFDQDSVINLPDIELLPYLIEKYDNKVLYIDVWSTWCGPCLDEMKYTPELHDYFKDKDVVFVNLCLESNVKQWAKTISQHEISGENYFLNKDATLLFQGENNISGYPSYLLIDKNRIMNSSVDRPSEMQKVIEQINSCL